MLMVPRKKYIFMDSLLLIWLALYLSWILSYWWDALYKALVPWMPFDPAGTFWSFLKIMPYIVSPIISMWLVKLTETSLGDMKDKTKKIIFIILWIWFFLTLCTIIKW